MEPLTATGSSLSRQIRDALAADISRRGRSLRSMELVLDCSYTVLSRWLRGESEPSAATLDAAAAYLGLQIIAPAPTPSAVPAGWTPRSNARLVPTSPAGSERVQALVAAAAAGDVEAFAALYDRLAPDLYAVLLDEVGDAATAEDLLGQVFTAVIAELPRRGRRQPFAAWLPLIVRTVVRDHQRVHARGTTSRILTPVR